MACRAPAPVSDRAGAPAGGGTGTTVSYFLENDVFVDKDDNYTSGIGVALTSPEVSTLKPGSFLRDVAEAASFLPTVGAEGYDTYSSITFGQEMYTPEDIEAPEAPSGEQPYAGILFLDTAVHARDRRSIHTYKLRLGVVGPPSGAEYVQRYVHVWVGTDVPQGWDDQLATEPLLNLDYRYGRRLWSDVPPDGLGFDLEGHLGAGAGNYYIGADLGLDARAGLRLPDTFGVQTLRSGSPGLVGAKPTTAGRWRSYASLGGRVIAIGRFLPTDGNTFRDSPSRERDDVYLSLVAGIVVGRDDWTLAYTLTGLGGFESFPEPRSDDFGTLTFSWFF